MQKIKNVSKLFRMLFQTIFIILPVLLLLFWMYEPFYFMINHSSMSYFISFIPHGIQILHPLSLETRVLSFIISLIPIVIIELILNSLVKLFRYYEKGDIFSIKSVIYIKRIGYLIIIGQLLNPAYVGLLSAALTWNNPRGHRYAEMIFGSSNIILIFTAFLIILISWIMAEAYKLSEEQKYTV